jgi:hypothetical protein
VSEVDRGGWIVVRKWEKFQHYKDRQPAWIKLYTELASNAEWLSLSDADRGVLTLIWIEYARSRNQLETNLMTIGSQNRPLLRRIRSLKRLSDAGFIDIVASKPLARVLAQKKSTTYSSKDALAREANREPRASAKEKDSAATGLYKEFLRPFVARFYDEYPDKDVFIDELTDRGATVAEALELIEDERRRRVTEIE